MEKVNIVFHNNGTVSYQHKKILNFVPEMSKDKDLKVIVPNIPLLVSIFQKYSPPLDSRKRWWIARNLR